MSAASGWRPRHVHYVPAIDLGRLQAALAGPADALLVDLEDGVLPQQKAAAREVCAEFLSAPEASAASMVRVNEPGSDLLVDDLRAIGGVVTTVLVPKLTSADDVATLAEQLSSVERNVGRDPGSIQIFAILETAAAVADVRAIAGASDRVSGLVLGQADLTVDLGCSGLDNDGFRPSPLLEHAHAQVVYAAVAAGLPSYVSPWVRHGDDGGQLLEMRRIIDLGYTGIVVYDASSVLQVMAARRPSASQEIFARGALAARDEAAERGEGKTTYEGWTIEGSYAQIVRRVADRADEGDL